MSGFEQEYRSKRVTHQELIARIKPGSSLAFGTWMGQPHGMMRALTKYARNIDPLYVSTAPASAAGEFLQFPNVHCTSGFLGPYERAALRERHNVSYTPTQFTDAYRAVRTNRPADYYIIRVAPLDERGRFNLSLSSSWFHDAIGWLVRHAPESQIVVEVNRHAPRVCGLPQFGDNEISIGDVDWVLEDDAPLHDYQTPEATSSDRAIAANVAALVEDRATIQFGFGTIPMVIGRLLAQRRDLGIHSEMFCQSHLDLIESGSVSNAYKGLYNGVSVATFALGDDRLYRWLADNRAYAMLPVEQVNPVTVLAQIERMTSINSALTIDLSGQACAHCLGPHTYSGVGGAFEFAYGAQLSPGGKSILCLASRTTLRNGRVVSNIVARHPHGTRITIPEHSVEWVVTEFGAVRLKFLSLEWRAAALIELAHPNDRETLYHEAQANGLGLNRLARHRRPPAEFFSNAV
ncbi:MAG: acetyl-CoA hydrolase/transferase family protein [Planctomycetaceae bacterium]